MYIWVTFCSIGVVCRSRVTLAGQRLSILLSTSSENTRVNWTRASPRFLLPHSHRLLSHQQRCPDVWTISLQNCNHSPIRRFNSKRPSIFSIARTFWNFSWKQNCVQIIIITIIAVISIAPYRTDYGEHMMHFYSNKGDTKYPCVCRRTQLSEILDYLQFVTCTVRRSGK